MQTHHEERLMLTYTKKNLDDTQNLDLFRVYLAFLGWKKENF